MEIHPYLTKEGLSRQLNLDAEHILTEGFLDGGVWFEDTKTIICGTFPPKEKYFNPKGYLHYSSAKNKFWQHIDALYGTNYYISKAQGNDRVVRINNAIDKIKFLKSKNIGFIDVFTEVKRIVYPISWTKQLIYVSVLHFV